MTELHQSGNYRATVKAALETMTADEIIERIWKHDHTVWKPDPDEITNRLGWLHIASTMEEQIPRLEQLVENVRDDDYTDVLLMGMGGSSLAPEVFSTIFDDEDGLELAVLDSTDPGAVLSYTEQLDLSRTLFIVASKSGTTTETLSFFKFFYRRAVEALGEEEAGEHFVAVTDPGSHLVDLGEQHRFQAVFRNDPHIGGRYSALSFFGLVPAALVGVDVGRLLDRALAMTADCASSVPAADNRCAQLGAILGELAQAGRDKVTIVISDPIASFGDWVEQLMAESTGKSGTGILPVVGEPLGPPAVYGDDRLFVQLRLEGDDAHDAALAEIEEAGHPVVTLNLRDRYDLGEQIFLWEMAIAVAGYRLGIQPFDQPNVEAAKVQARRMVERYTETGELPSGESAPVTADALHAFLAERPTGGSPSPHADRSYIALQAYVQPTPETTEALQALRVQLRDRYQLATTLGYGPRFLHSTGQLHKGDAGNGLFIQFTSDSPRDAAIPDEPGAEESSITFGVLKMAQALGDRQALEDAGRRVIRFHLGEKVIKGLQQLTETES